MTGVVEKGIGAGVGVAISAGVGVDAGGVRVDMVGGAIYTYGDQVSPKIRG